MTDSPTDDPAAPGADETPTGVFQAIGELARRGADDEPAAATIDVAAAPPLAPLAPVDTFDREQISGVLDICARIGDILIQAGTTNSDACAHGQAVAESFGVWNVHVDMTASRIRLFAHVGGNSHHPVAHVRVMRGGAQDFDRLEKVDQLIRDIHAGRCSPAEARDRLDAIESAHAPLGLAGVTAAWAGMGGAVAFLLGGDWPVAVISTLAAAVIILMSAFLGRHGLPLFFQNTAGGVFASLLASASYHLGSHVGLTLRPSMVIATSIVAMLAGLTLVQAIQNGVTGAPVTGTARFFDTAMITGGVVAGVGIGIVASGLVGFSLPPMETTAAPNLASATVRVLGSVGATAAFARACYAAWDSVLLSAATAAIGSSLYYFLLIPQGFGYISASAVMAILIGLIGGLLGRFFRVPPLIIAIAGITPLLPGLSIYRGMYGLLHDQTLIGFGNLTVALATATALSAGVVLGEWIARRFRRPRFAKRGQS